MCSEYCNAVVMANRIVAMMPERFSAADRDEIRRKLIEQLRAGDYEGAMIRARIMTNHEVRVA